METSMVRNAGQSIDIDDINVKIDSVQRNRVRITVTAPDGTVIKKTEKAHLPGYEGETGSEPMETGTDEANANAVNEAAKAGFGTIYEGRDQPGERLPATKSKRGEGGAGKVSGTMHDAKPNE